MKTSLIIVSFFLLGVLLSANGAIPTRIQSYNAGFYALCALMLCVGISVGNDSRIARSLKQADPHLLALPLMTIGGTLAGCCLAGLFIPGRSLADCMAVGAGFGYYSLSSIIITEYRGAELGTIALVSNITRELIALLCAPFLIRFFGRLSPISVGGATTMDTTLPIIARFSGKEFVVVSIFHGCVVDLSVPFLVTFFCTI